MQLVDLIDLEDAVHIHKLRHLKELFEQDVAEASAKGEIINKDDHCWSMRLCCLVRFYPEVLKDWDGVGDDLDYSNLIVNQIRALVFCETGKEWNPLDSSKELKQEDTA